MHGMNDEPESPTGVDEKPFGAGGSGTASVCRTCALKAPALCGIMSRSFVISRIIIPTQPRHSSILLF